MADCSSSDRALVSRFAPAVFHVHQLACLTAHEFMNWSYSEDEVRDWYAGRFASWDWELVAENGGALVGFLATSGTFLNQLFVDQDHQIRGIGTARHQ